MNRKSLLTRLVLVQVFLVITVVILYYGKGFLAPLAVAVVLATAMMPIEKKFRHLGMSKGVSVMLSTLLILMIAGGFFLLLTLQAQQIAGDWPIIYPKLLEIEKAITGFVENNLGVEWNEPPEALVGQVAAIFSYQAMGIVGFLADLGLILAYMSTMLLSRNRIKRFLLELVGAKTEKEGKDLLADIAAVSRQYFFGQAVVVLTLATLYCIGFLIIGVPYPLFVGLTAGIFAFIPYIGNLVGFLLLVLMSLISDQTLTVLIAGSGYIAFTQVIEGYLLTPVIVGKTLDINPLFSIVFVVAGGLLWGLVGMLLALPLFGMLRVLCDHVPGLQPYGYLISTGNRKEGESDGSS